MEYSSRVPVAVAVLRLQRQKRRMQKAGDKKKREDIGPNKDIA